MSTKQERSATLAKPKPEGKAGAERHRTNVRPQRGEAQEGPNGGRGTGRCRVTPRVHAWLILALPMGVVLGALLIFLFRWFRLRRRTPGGS